MLILISVQGTCLLMQMPDGKDAFEYLRELCQSGLEKRYSPVSDELQKRLDYELGVIKSMGVCGLLSYCMGLHTFLQKITVLWSDRGVEVRQAVSLRTVLA